MEVFNACLPLVASPNPDAIYCADLFRIDNRVWLIAGHGKSTAARVASQQVCAADLSHDSVALIRDGDRLYGRHDAGAWCANPHCTLHTLHQIDVLAYCLNATESAQVYASHPLNLVEVDNSRFALMLAREKYSAFFANLFFDRETMARLRDPIRMLERFIELTSGVQATLFYTVPWMPSVEAKAALYTNKN